MAITANGQWEIAGLLLGQGTHYPISKVTGLGVPGTKTATLDLPTADGGVAGPEWLTTREVQIELGVDGDPDTSAYDALFAVLSAAWTPGADPTLVRWQRFGRVKRLLARPGGLVEEWDDDFHLGAAKCIGRLVCADPTIYSDAATVATGSGSMSTTNAGNRGVWPIITVSGPSASVVLRNDSDGGRQVALDNLNGDAVVDFGRRTVTVGGANAYPSVRPGSAWWRVQPGSNSLSLTGASSFTVTFRAGWLSG
jgi:hypothetical protein